MSNPESNMADVTDAEAAPARAELVEKLGRRVETFNRLLSQQYWLPTRAHIEGLRNNIQSAVAAFTSDDAKDRRRISELERERDDAWAANERDRSRVADALNAITDEVDRRSWLCSSRGSYEWDDERYQQEFSQALDAIGAATERLKAVAGDWSHSPMSDSSAQSARIDWKARAEAAEAQLRLSSGTEDGVRALADLTAELMRLCEDDQFAVATKIAANVGYVLVPGPGIDPPAPTTRRT